MIGDLLIPELVAGRMVLTDLGQWTQANKPELLASLGASDAMACCYANLTEAGKIAHDERSRELHDLVASKREDPQYFFDPVKYCKRDRVIAEAEYHEGEARRIREWLSK